MAKNAQSTNVKVDRSPAWRDSDLVIRHSFVIRHSVFSSHTPTKGVLLVQQECRFRGYECGADDGRLDSAPGAVKPAISRGEKAAQNALLHPRLAFVEFVVGGEAGELGARAGAARGAVVRFAGAKNKVARARPRTHRRTEQFDVVNFGKALRVHRLADAPGQFGERSDLAKL